VLCVGGIKHAVARYRRRIEQLGGQFAHHDGGIEESVQTLEARLNRADLVICQAACINHEAYHRVKRHCERTGTPCVYLDRPSLSRFERALGCAQGAPS
jgi:siroheme synthase (precorrin-2 oxidase/ferrochelatase)